MKSLQLILKTFTLFFCLVSMTGCIAYFEKPLTDPEAQAIDPLIYGTWVWNDKNESGFIHIGKDDKSGLLRVVMVEFENQNEIDEVTEYFGHTSMVDGNKYLNLKWVPQNEDGIDGYIFVKYEITQDRLGIYIMDSLPVKKAVEAGSLKGTVIKQQWNSIVHVTTMDQKKLGQFILENDKALFKDLKYFPRLKLQ